MIEHVLIIAMLCKGVHALTREGMILGIVEGNSYNKDGNLYSIIQKPIFECDVCMVSYWGILYFCAFGAIDVGYGFAFVVLTNILLALNIKKLISDRVVENAYLLLFSIIVLFSPQTTMILCSTIAACGVNYSICKMSN